MGQQDQDTDNRYNLASLVQVKAFLPTVCNLRKPRQKNAPTSIKRMLSTGYIPVKLIIARRQAQTVFIDK